MGRRERLFDRVGTREPTGNTARLFGRAVVLGGSVAGLVAARVLADHSDEVVIVEPDQLDASAAVRHGVPQARQVHTLLPGGRRQLDRWFDGFGEELIAGGAGVAGPINTRVYFNGVLKLPVQAELVMSTRGYLEATLRRRVLALPRVTVVTGQATGLQLDGGSARGVRYRGAAGDAELPADFVVDAMGRSSKLSNWLRHAGWPAPELERLQVGINYTTALFHRTEPHPDVALALTTWAIGRTPEGLAPAVLSAVEGDRWIVMLGGYQNDKPGRQLDELRRICAGLPPEFGQAVSGELLEPIAGYTQGDSRRRDYSSLSRLPARLVSVGDAVASFNPIYGQGMTSAMLHASCLSDHLRSGSDLDAPARRFLNLQRIVVDAAWQTSAIPDLGLPHVQAPRPPGFGLLRAFGNMLVDGTVDDPVLARQFAEVTFMQAHPDTLRRPPTLARVLLRAAGRSVGRVRHG